MSNIITRGLKGTFKVILRGFFGFTSGDFRRICRSDSEPAICQRLSTNAAICQKLTTDKAICQKLSTEG